MKFAISFVGFQQIYFFSLGT